MLYEQVGNISKWTEIIKRNQIEITGLQSAITEIKNFLGVQQGYHAEEEISDLENIAVEITQSEERKRK